MPTYPFSLPDGRTGKVQAKDPDDAAYLLKTRVLPDMLRRAGDVDGQVQDMPGPKKSSYDISGTASSPPWPTPYAIPRDTPPGAAPITEPPPGPSGGSRQIAPTADLKPLDRPPVAKEVHEANLAKEKADLAKYDPAEGLPWYTKAGIGLNAGLANAATGIQSLIGTATPEEIADRKEREASSKYLGGWGTAGRLTGETALTLPVGGPVAKGAGTVLTKAIPAMEAVGKWGGKVLNLGAVGSGAVQGAVQEGLVGSADDEGDLGKRAVEAVKGGAAGGAMPIALKVATLPLTLGAKGLTAIKNAVVPSAKDLQERAYKAIKEAIGEEGVVNARRAMEHAEPPTIPQTSAAMAQSEPLGALERGARMRGNADFNAHDEAVARSAWEQLQPLPGHGSDAGEVLRGEFMRNGFAKTNRQFGQAPDIVPDVQSRPLRQALAKYSEHMSPDEVDVGRALANDLAKRDVVRFGQGTVTPTVKSWTDHIPLVLGGYIKAKSFGMGNVLMNRAKVNAANDLRISKQDAIMKEIDEALLDPQKFQTMVDEVRTRILGNEPLSKGQQVIKRIAEETTDALSRTAADKAND